MDNSCGSVGRAVAYESRDPRFGPSHRHFFIDHLLSTVLKFEKTKRKEKEAEKGPLQKTVFKGSPVRVHRLHSWSRVRKPALLARCRNVLGQRLGATATYNA